MTYRSYALDEVVAYDNTMAEAWVATFKSELVDGRHNPNVDRHLTEPPRDPGWITRRCRRFGRLPDARRGRDAV
jgi:hypothetical protein